MRIDTSGSQFDSHGSAHRITHGFHNHHETGEKIGNMPSAAANTSASKQVISETSGEGLSLWRTITNGAKNLWRHVWGETGGGVNVAGSSVGETVGEEQLMAQIGAVDVAEGLGMDTHGPALAAAASVTQAPIAKENPYFTAVSEKEENKDSFIQKIRIRFRELTDQFKKRFHGRFGGRTSNESSGRGALDSGQNKPKEDLRKHSRYREDGVEMDCVLTDDSYLMDSYDRSGGYSKLTTDTGAKNRGSLE